MIGMMVLSFLAGCGVFTALRPRAEALSLLPIAAGAGIGIGMLSCFYFVYISAAGSAGSNYLIVDAIFCAACAMIGSRIARWRTVPAIDAAQATSSSPLRKVLHIVLAINVCGALGALITQSLMYPYGNWDAMAIWNNHARVLFRSGEFWNENYSELPMWTHGNYPLLLPAFVSRCWEFSKVDSPGGPALVAATFTLGTAALLYSFLKRLVDASSAALAAAILLGFWTFTWLGAAQYGDIPVAYFELGALGMLCLAETSGSRSTLVLAGMFAGFAAWTKNDALPFICGMIVIHALVSWRLHSFGEALTRASILLLGALPGLAALIYFKVTVAPPNWIMAEQRGIPWDKLSDLSRHAAIAKAFAASLLRVAPAVTPPVLLLAYAILAGVRMPERCRAAAITALLTLPFMLAVFYAVYLITPTPLEWQLEHSLDRVLMQLLPSCLLVLFLFTRPLEAQPQP